MWTAGEAGWDSGPRRLRQVPGETTGTREGAVDITKWVAEHWVEEQDGWIAVSTQREGKVME